MKNWVIAKKPRNKPFLVLGVFWLISILVFLMEYYLIFPDIFSFDGERISIKFESSTVKGIACISFVFMTIAFSIASIRNNIKSQPIESCIFLFGGVWLLFFIVFSTPLTFLWAHIHGYHLDHYEAAHRGGWYIFRLNGN